MKHVTYYTGSLTNQVNEKIVKRKIVPIKWQALGWLGLIALYFFYEEYVKEPPFNSDLDFLIFVAYTIAVFYFNVNIIFPRVVKTKVVLLRLIVYLFLEVFVMLALLIAISIDNLPGILFFLFLGLIFSMGCYRILWGLRENERREIKKARISALQHKNKMLELENLKLDLPHHFVLNTFILLRHCIKNEPEIGAECFRLCSEIMRFYSIVALDDLISFEEEIKQLNSYISMHELRFGKKMFIEIQQPEDSSYIPISPMLLLTLAENIFKYGVLFDSSKRAQINCTLEENQFNIKALNWTEEGKTAVYSTSSGLSGLQKRLAHFYPDSYTFNAERIDDRYEVSIRIDLDDSY